MQQIEINFVPSALDVPSASALPSTGSGADCIFVGRTRPECHEKHGDLTALQYECYTELATTELENIALEAIARFSANCIRITHSIGTVPVHEASVVIAVRCDHRREAFSACRFLIDLLKLRVPIWKQEIWSDGTTWSPGKELPIDG
jgi:molybdopterin synthase catalytic subunit